MISGVTAEDFAEQAGAAPRRSKCARPGMCDIAPILELINGYAAKGIMLPRTEFEISEHIRDFSVVLTRRPLAGLRRVALLYANARRNPLAGGRSRAPRPTASAAGWWSALVEEAQEYDWTPSLRSPTLRNFFGRWDFTKSSAAFCRSKPGRTASAALSSSAATKLPWCGS